MLSCEYTSLFDPRLDVFVGLTVRRRTGRVPDRYSVLRGIRYVIFVRALVMLHVWFSTSSSSSLTSSSQQRSPQQQERIDPLFKMAVKGPRWRTFVVSGCGTCASCYHPCRTPPFTRYAIGSKSRLVPAVMHNAVQVRDSRVSVSVYCSLAEKGNQRVGLT